MCRKETKKKQLKVDIGVDGCSPLKDKFHLNIKKADILKCVTLLLFIYLFICDFSIGVFVALFLYYTNLLNFS